MTCQLIGRPLHTEQVGISEAEVYCEQGTYYVFLMGDQVACFLGATKSFEDCLEEIKCLKELASEIGIA